MSDQRDTITDLVTQNILWESYVRAGEKAWMRKEHVEALRNFNVAREKSKHFKVGDWRQIKTLQSISRLYYELKNFPEAERLQSEIVNMVEKENGPDSVEMQCELRHLACIYEQGKKYKEAEDTYRFMVQHHPLGLAAGGPDVQLLKDKIAEMRRRANVDARSGNDIEWLG